MRRPHAVVVSCFVLALLLGAHDQVPPERTPRPPCFPEERTYPPGFTERAFDRFFARALEVVGDRVSHEGQGCVKEGRLGADIGMKDLTDMDRRRIEALAPPWVEVNLFETEYSMDELEAFAERAQAVLDETGLHVYSGHGFYATPGKVEIYVTKDWVGVHKLLSTVIPPDAFVVGEEEPAITLLSSSF